MYFCFGRPMHHCSGVDTDPIAAAMAAKDGTKWWLLHRLIMTMAAAGRQKKADEVVKQQRKAEERAKT
jgi:hypothetical protein